MRHGIVTVVTRIRDGREDALRELLKELDGNSNRFPCDELTRLHFASMSVIDSSTDHRPDFRPHLVFEASFDGTREEFVDDLIAQLGCQLHQIYIACEGYPQGGSWLPQVVKHYLLDNDLGAELLYLGYPGRSVGQIKQEASLRIELRDELARMRQGLRKGLFQPPTQRAIVNALRRAIGQIASLQSVLTVPERPFVITYGGRLAEYALSAILALSFLTIAFRFYEPTTGTLGGGRVSVHTLSAVFFSGFIVARSIGIWRRPWRRISYSLLLMGLVMLAASRVPAFAEAVRQGGVILLMLGALALSIVLGVVMVVALTALVAQVHEWLDAKPDPPRWDPDRENLLRRREDRGPQNHMVGLTRIKPGRMRRWILKLVLWTIDITKYLAKSGTLSGVSSIHFARWTLIDEQRQLLFLTHYDGDRDSYLGDFVSQASSGMTAIWSNCVGFPRSFLLFRGGARDDRAFKAYARNHQHETLFLYSAYPKLTVTQIETNTALREGLCESLDDAGVDALLRRI